jgi:hypothetical protein
MFISFDFDGTISDEFDGSINTQKGEIQELARKYVREGHRVCIITKRYDRNNNEDEYSSVMDLAKKIGISQVYFTNREMKFSKIINLKIDIHFENSDYEIKLINQACSDHNHKCLVVPVEDPYWRDLVY